MSLEHHDFPSFCYSYILKDSSGGHTGIVQLESHDNQYENLVYQRS